MFLGENNSSRVCNVTRRLPYEEVVEMLLNTPDDLCTCWPPSKPKNGDIFIFIYQEEKHHFDFVADGMNWCNQGTRLCSKENLVVKKRYYQRRIGKESVDFRKCVFEISSISRVLIQYLGPRDEELPEAPHGNRRKQLDKGHIRVMPSVLADIKESKDGAEETYMKMVADCRVPAQNFKVALPRNMKQVENRKQYEKRQDTVDKCEMSEVDALLSLNTELGGFIKYMTIVPSLNVVMIHEQLLQEWADIISTGEKCFVSFVTRLKFHDYYLSFLIGRHHQFENDPVIPLAYMIHHRLTTDSYKLLLREVLDLVPAMNAENVILVADMDKAIHDAWSHVIKNAHQLTGWDSIKKTAQHQLKKLRITGLQKKSHLEDISHLLLAKNELEYKELFENLHCGWAHEFVFAYKTHLYEEVKSSIRGKLAQLGAYTQDCGVLVMECEAANDVTQGLAAWSDPRLEGVALALSLLSIYSLSEVTRGYAKVGTWKLRQEYSTSFREMQEMQSEAIEPHDIVPVVQSKYGMME